MTLLKASTLAGIHLSTLSGQVTGLQTAVEEHIDHDPHDSLLRFLPKRKVYVARFMLGDKALEAQFQEPYRISEGDYLHVSGRWQKNNSFGVIAYRNETQSYAGSDNWIVAVIVGIAFALGAIFVLFRLMSGESMWGQVMMVIFVLVGLFITHQGLLVREALSLLK